MSQLHDDAISGAANRSFAKDVSSAFGDPEQTAQFGPEKLREANPHALNPDPIPAGWILDGQPRARSKLLVGSSDHMASTHMWDCTAGHFNWFYTVDEVIHVVEGSVVVEDAAGERRELRPGDTFLFPAGSRFTWTVPQYIRKIAFLHSPLSRKLRLAKRIFQILTSPFRRSPPPVSGFRT